MNNKSLICHNTSTYVFHHVFKDFNNVSINIVARTKVFIDLTTGFDQDGVFKSTLICVEAHQPIGKKWPHLKALVWFWIIDETLVLTSMLSVCRLNEVGTCQVMEQEMIIVIMVMTTRWSSAQLGKEEWEKQNSMEIKANVLLRVLVLVIKTP